jgi:hypothetical protein
MAFLQLYPSFTAASEGAPVFRPRLHSCPTEHNAMTASAETDAGARQCNLGDERMNTLATPTTDDDTPQPDEDCPTEDTDKIIDVLEKACGGR